MSFPSHASACVCVLTEPGVLPCSELKEGMDHREPYGSVEVGVEALPLGTFCMRSELEKNVEGRAYICMAVCSSGPMGLPTEWTGRTSNSSACLALFHYLVSLFPIAGSSKVICCNCKVCDGYCHSRQSFTSGLLYKYEEGRHVDRDRCGTSPPNACAGASLYRMPENLANLATRYCMVRDS